MTSPNFRLRFACHQESVTRSPTCLARQGGPTMRPGRATQGAADVPISSHISLRHVRALWSCQNARTPQAHSRRRQADPSVTAIGLPNPLRDYANPIPTTSEMGPRLIFYLTKIDKCRRNLFFIHLYLQRPLVSAALLDPFLQSLLPSPYQAEQINLINLDLSLATLQSSKHAARLWRSYVKLLVEHL